MKKTLALTTMTALSLVKTAAAENRIQYSMEDATAAANKDANTFSWTFSGKTSRADNTVDASTPVSLSGGASGGENSSSGPVSQWNEDGTNKITGTLYDEDGYNIAGFDENGLYRNDGYYGSHIPDNAWVDGNRSSRYPSDAYLLKGIFDDEGYDVDGYDISGHDRDGNYACSDETSFCETHYCYGGNYGVPTINAKASCWQCFTADTLITLTNGRAKRADEITYDDDLLVWNFDEGKLDHAKPIWIQVPKISPNHNYMRFSDGSVLKTINQHRIFNIEAGKFTYPMTDETPVGTHTLNAKGEVVELVEKKVIEEEVTYYNLWTERHINCFAGNVLTSCRLNNIYPIKDLKFVKDDRKLVPFSAFDKLDRKWYDGLRLAEQPEVINHDGDVSFNDKSVQDYVLRSIRSMKA